MVRGGNIFAYVLQFPRKFIVIYNLFVHTIEKKNNIQYKPTKYIFSN